MAAPEGTHAPGGHPGTPSRPSDSGKGHQSHPQGSRRPEDNHTEMASLACGTAAGDHHKSPPANPAGHRVPRLCVEGGNGPDVSGAAFACLEPFTSRIWHLLRQLYHSSLEAISLC